jgi:hypothetical protein
VLRLISGVPYQIHAVLTDDPIQFTTPGRLRFGRAVDQAIANGTARLCLLPATVLPSRLGAALGRSSAFVIAFARPKN